MGYSVLVVDDDKELRKIYRALLERVGYTIYEAGNGAEALQFLTTQKIIPDVMVMDMLMPLLNGDALIQRVRQTPSLDPMKIIMLSAYPRYRGIGSAFPGRPVSGEADQTRRSDASAGCTCATARS